MSKLDDTVKRLQKRKDWLDKRIRENPDKDLSYDRAESSALAYALAKLKSEREEDDEGRIKENPLN